MLRFFQRALKRRTERGAVDLVSILVGLAILVVISVWVLPNLLGQRSKGVDGGIRSDLNNMAIMEQTFITDNPTIQGIGYANGNWVALDVPAGYTPDTFRSSPGNVIVVGVAKTTAGAPTAERGFCIKGWNPNASTDYQTSASSMWYDSALGGIQPGHTQPSGGACQFLSGSMPTS